MQLQAKDAFYYFFYLSPSILFSKPKWIYFLRQTSQSVSYINGFRIFGYKLCIYNWIYLVF